MLRGMLRHHPRLRGNRRYYRNLERRAKRFRLELSPSDWYDLWHEHADSRGLGRSNRSARARRSHLLALRTMFERALAQTADYDLPHQLWLDLCLQDGGRDALYFHTPNPNLRGEFPNRYASLFTWDEPLPPIFSLFDRPEIWQVGRFESPAERLTYYAIRRRGARW